MPWWGWVIVGFGSFWSLVAVVVIAIIVWAVGNG